MSSCWGNHFKISLFGESHGEGVGVVMDNVPAGVKIDPQELLSFMARRAPGKDRTSTPRKEEDLPKVLSGMQNWITCGTPICAVIANTNTHSSDYQEMESAARPGHADYTGFVRYQGFNDIRGGGHFSARVTAGLVFAGGVCKQILAKKGITIGAHLLRVHGVSDTAFDPVAVTPETLLLTASSSFPTINAEAGEKMRVEIEKARLDCDSVGGVVECCAVGLPAGIGSPMFDGIENLLSSILFGIPAVKGVEFGAGFACADWLGSQNNDPFYMDEKTVKTSTNHCGGVLGGITTGMPLLFRTALKPTSSIGKEQKTINYITNEECTLKVRGRHDPCVAVRAVPCVEAACAIALCEILSSAHTL